MATFPRVLLRRLGVMCLALAAAPVTALAPDSLEKFVFPRDGASSADDIYVLYGRNCGRPVPDSRAPAVTREAGQVVVEIYLVEPENLFCPAVLQPDTIVATPVGKLDRGEYTVKRRLMIRLRDAQDYRLLDESVDYISVGNAPNPSVSGTWYDPARPGAGITINLLPDAPPEFRGRAVLFLATFDQDGAPLWLSGVGTFSDAQLSVPLRRAGIASGAAPDATALFEYAGCGSARLSVSGTALGFPVGTVDLTQLTLTAGLPGCTPPLKLPQDFD